MSLRPQPEVPVRMKHLDVDPRLGLVVPWFVSRETSPIDFRVADGSKIGPAYKKRLCWVCGGKLGASLAFVIGPMCAVSRTTSEPPSHLECAHYSVQVCPFLSNPRMRRSPRAIDRPDKRDPAGVMIERNPGVSAIWITRDYKPFTAHVGKPGSLFRVGDARAVEWWAEGRAATREEVLYSIETGFPALLQVAELQGPEAVRDLYWARRDVEQWLPQAECAA